MELKISLPTGEIDEIRSLWTWLSDDPSVRRHGQMRWSGQPVEGAMSDGLDVIALSVTSALSVAQLVFAVLSWRNSRPRRDNVVAINYRGRHFALDEADPAQERRALRELTGDEGIVGAAARAEP